MKPETPLHRALRLISFAALGLALAIVAACATALPTPELTPTPTRTPRPTVTPVPPTPSPSPTPAWPVTVYIPQGLPAPVADSLNAAIAAHPDLFSASSAADGAEVEVHHASDQADASIATWTYALVAPFPTIVDEVAWEDFTASWSGQPSGPFAGQPLLMSAETAIALNSFLNQAAEGSVEILPEDQIVQQAWDLRPSWAVVPFEQLDPRWKVLRISGMSLLHKDLDAAAYPLVLRLEVSGLDRGVSKLQEILAGPIANRDPSKMTTVLMTGVTALSRATAIRMDRHGVTYPAQDIRHWLLEADITHTSNEVSFAEDCPPPSDYTTMVFCSNPSYIGLLEDAGFDVIELTGNHLLDWGVDAMRLTLRMYEERGIHYYGGGWNRSQAQQPLTITSGVHTFGFIGCNPAGPRSDWATDELPGSAPCDYELMAAEIGQMRQQGIIPIVTLQYIEFYQYDPTPQQRADFQALARAGATIVSGSQAHQPQGWDLVDGAYIHYGLGNLFFDQMWSLETRQEFLDRHVFYDGRHVSTEILTAILEDYARPRPMTAEEREALLSAAFTASGW